MLQYLADARPESGLAPAWGGFERYQLIDTLNYLGTELHKRIFYQVFAPTSSEPAKQAARALIEPTLDHLVRAPRRSRHAGRDQLHGGRRLSGDHAELVRLRRRRSREVAGAARLPPEAPKRPSVAQAMGVEMEERKRRLAA